jgi:hypothetical protein
MLVVKSGIPPQQGQQTVPVPAAIGKFAPDGSGDHPGALLLDAAHGHAEVFRFQFHRNALGSQGRQNSIGNLAGQPFLNLRAAAGQIQGAGKLADTGDPAVGDVSQAGGAEEGQKVMFTHGIKGDIAQYYRVGAFLVKNGVYGVFGVKAHTGKKLAVRTSYPLGGFSQTLTGRIFSNRFQKVRNDMFDPWLNSIIRPLGKSMCLLYGR